MNFEEFQNQSRLYVLGTLEPEELEEFETERKKSGKKAEDFIKQCYALHGAFALSFASSEGFRRNRRTAYVDGTGTETRERYLKRNSGCLTTATTK
jgi:hypothetical protein